MRAGNRPRSMARRSRSAVPRAAISRATTSRGASSSVNRSPRSSRRRAPSPRSASDRSTDESTSVVGWNWVNSRSATAAPARYAAAMPSPTAPGGFVVRCQSAAAPPVAISVARAETSPRSVTTPTQRSSAVASASMRSPSSTRMRGCASTRSARTRATRSPGRRSSGMNDAAARVRALEAEALVELDAEIHEVADPRGCLVGENRDRRSPGEPASGGERVGRVQGR